MKYPEIFNRALFCFFLFLSATTSAQPILELWPEKVPGEIKAKQAPQIAPPNEGITRIQEITNPTLTTYIPVKGNNGIGVIVCPGGGYGILAIDLEGSEIAEWLTQLGYTAYVLSYRVPNKQMGALQDIQRAIRLVRQHNPSLKQLGIIGFSAGGSLSARACTRFRETLYPVTDQADSLSCRPDFALLIYPAYLDLGSNLTITPELKITPETPPMFIFGTNDDPFGNSALVMTQALRDKHIPVELHFMAYGGHGYGLRSGAGRQWPPLAENWLKQFLVKAEK